MAARFEQLLSYLTKNSFRKGLSVIGIIAFLYASRRAYRALTKIDLEKRKLAASYDYVVIGAGSAGCAVASRLSEDPSVSVLLLESGGETSDLPCVMPLACSTLQMTTRDWQFKTEPQEHNSATCTERRGRWPRGKGLGGSSVLNYMAYVRGNKEDYEAWERAGCVGWGWKEVLDAFKKSENNTSKRSSAQDSKVHGHDGPLSVSDLQSPYDISKRFVQASEEVGIPAVRDYNHPDTQLGAGLLQFTQINGERCSSARAFLRPEVLRRPNLHVLCHAHTRRIIFTDRDGIPTATAVEYQRVTDCKDGHSLPVSPPQTINVKKEVIVSGGAVQSPQILMLSGVGPAEELKKHRINVVADLPVGRNLRDHLFHPMTFVTSVPTMSFRTFDLIKYLLFRRGPATTPALEGTSFVKTGIRPDLGNRPDLQIHFLATCGEPQDPRGESRTNIDERWRSTTPEELKAFPKAGYILLPVLLHPQSIGTITLRSADPFDHPLINPNYLQHENDVATLRAGAKICARMAKDTKALGEVTLQEHLGRVEATCPYEKGTDEYWNWRLAQLTFTLYHPVGTCAMGPRESKEAVVDPQLRVIGVNGVRVADCSIMPTLVSGNTNAPAIMVGERCAEFIRSGR